MVVSQGDVFWASLAAPTGSGPGFRRPVVIVQGDPFNASRLATVVVVPLTSNLRLAAAPGNVRLDATRTGLPKDSVANVSQIVTVDRTVLSERVGRLTDEEVALILGGIEQARGVHGRPLDQLRAAELELRVRERVLEIDQENAGRSPGSMLPCPWPRLTHGSFGSSSSPVRVASLLQDRAPSIARRAARRGRYWYIGVPCATLPRPRAAASQSSWGKETATSDTRLGSVNGNADTFTRRAAAALYANSSHLCGRAGTPLHLRNRCVQIRGLACAFSESGQRWPRPQHQHAEPAGDAVCKALSEGIVLCIALS